MLKAELENDEAEQGQNHYRAANGADIHHCHVRLLRGVPSVPAAANVVPPGLRPVLAGGVGWTRDGCA
jgi:hypothetical protein